MRKTMKKLNITKEQFNKSRYFKDKYGKLEYVSESGKLFKTNKGQILKFNESDVDYLIERQWARVGVKYDKRGWKTSLIYTDDNGNEVCFKWRVVKEILADI